MRGSEDAGALCGMKGRFSDVEFDGKCRIILVSNFVIVGVRMALAIEMNWRFSKSTTLGTDNSMRNGMARMGWLCIDVDMFLFLHAAVTAILVAGVVTTAVLLHIDVFYTHMGERSALLLCIIPTKGTSFVFATCCLLIFLHSSVLLCKLKALSTYVSKMTLAADA